MLLKHLQRLSAAAFSALRRGLFGCGKWIQSHPRLAAWFYRPGGTDADYREFNGWYFAQFSEQEKMLADHPRMNFYLAAIGRHVRTGDLVIDLGTGTGILAAFAARQGAGKVYAIDHSGILKHARQIAEHNQIKDIEFVAIHSRDFKTSEPVDVILHEQMGDFLFDEAMVANVVDLRDRLLRPGGKIVPARFEFFCEPVKVNDSRHIPFIWELNVHGYDYSCLDRNRPQETSYYQHASCDLGVIEHFLGEPVPALTVDLQTIREADLPHQIKLTRTVINAGRLDGFAVYFRAFVDTDLSLSSSPLDPGRAPHWGFRILRSEAATFAKGDVLEFTLTADQWSKPDTWRWSQRKVNNT